MDESRESKAAEYTLLLFGQETGLSDPISVRNWLENEIRHLLEHDYNRLLSILYRIDVSEKKARACFGGSTREVAACLAELIWERQLQKAANRMKS